MLVYGESLSVTLSPKRVSRNKVYAKLAGRPLKKLIFSSVSLMRNNVKMNPLFYQCSRPLVGQLIDILFFTSSLTPGLVVRDNISLSKVTVISDFELKS